MSKWVISLCASLYIILLVFGAPSETDETKLAKAPLSQLQEASEPAAEPVAAIPAAQPVIEAAPAAQETQLQTAAATAIEVQVISSSLDAERVSTSSATLQDTAAPVQKAVEIVAAPAAEPAPPAQPEIWTVTGSRVNLRQGPSTSDLVVGTARGGDSAELLELLETGWARVYVYERGIEAFISARFLQPQNS